MGPPYPASVPLPSGRGSGRPVPRWGGACWIPACAGRTRRAGGGTAGGEAIEFIRPNCYKLGYLSRGLAGIGRRDYAGEALMGFLEEPLKNPDNIRHYMDF